MRESKINSFYTRQLFEELFCFNIRKCFIEIMLDVDKVMINKAFNKFSNYELPGLVGKAGAIWMFPYVCYPPESYSCLVFHGDRRALRDKGGMEGL